MGNVTHIFDGRPVVAKTILTIKMIIETGYDLKTVCDFLVDEEGQHELFKMMGLEEPVQFGFKVYQLEQLAQETEMEMYSDPDHLQMMLGGTELDLTPVEDEVETTALMGIDDLGFNPGCRHIANCEFDRSGQEDTTGGDDW